MPLIITTVADLEAEATQIQGELDVTMSEDANEAVERGNRLIVFLSRSSKMLADAKHHLNVHKKSEIMDMVRRLASERLSSTMQKELVSCACADNQHLVDLVTELNKSLKYQIEWCRTIVSKAKAELMAGQTIGG